MDQPMESAPFDAIIVNAPGCVRVYLYITTIGRVNEHRFQPLDMEKG